MRHVMDRRRWVDIRVKAVAVKFLICITNNGEGFHLRTSLYTDMRYGFEDH